MEALFSPRTQRRIVRHHLPIVLASALGILGVLAATRGRPGEWFRWSMATAYVSLALLAATMITGPVAVLRKDRNPVSSDLRRDLGIWAGITALAHFVFGWQVHANHRYEYWLRAVPDSSLYLPRIDLFGFANYTGLAGVAIVSVLLALSNDRSLGALGARRWKALQRWNYWLAGLVLLHAIAYEIMERRTPGFVIAGAAIVAVTGAFQFRGWKAIRRERAKR